LRIAIHNQYAGQEVAETEFSKKIRSAALNLGWEAVEVGTSTEIKEFDPDFVIALHFRTPKLTKYPTYGSMVSPPVYFDHDNQFVKNILSYDGYLSSSDHISAWLRDILYTTRKRHFITSWYTTCQKVPYTPPRLTHPRLLYAGTNWDGPRFAALLRELDLQPYTDIYGPASAWTHIHQSYRGTLPFDGSSILQALHSAGVGLCLHREEHCATGTPSTRIFEIAASGAVAICQDHPFIRDAFQDSVLYLESGADATRLTAQISEYLQWIAHHQEDALKLSRRAYDIFYHNYTLEKLLSDLATRHEELVSTKNPRAIPSSKGSQRNSVQLIVRVGDRGAEYLQRALDSIKRQSYGPVDVILVQYKKLPYLPEVLEKYGEELSIRVVQSSHTGIRSTQLWDGLKAVSAEYFGILDDDDVLYPNHVGLLVRLLETAKDSRAAYSGAVRVWEVDAPSNSLADRPSEPAELTYFEAFDLNRIVALENFITSNAYIAKSSLLESLTDDPRLPVLEDLFLLLHLCRQTDFVFSYEVTCEFYWRNSKKDNSVLSKGDAWNSTAKRIQDILWRESFRSTQGVGPSGFHRLKMNVSEMEKNLSQLQNWLAQVDQALARTTAQVEAMDRRLNRYLDIPVLQVLRRLRRMLLRLPPDSHR
jgi:Glycosyl transferase family 2